MSIAKRVSDAIDRMDSCDPEGSLFQICAAIDTTAANEYGTHGRSSYKRFIHESFGLITSIAFGRCRILNLNLAYVHPKLKKNPDGLVSVQDILYHVVRCGLYHDSTLPTNLRFSEEQRIQSGQNGVLVLPSSLIYGLIAAVVVSPANRSEDLPKEGIMNLGNFAIPISKLWGRRNELLWLIDVVNEVGQPKSSVNS